MGVAFVQSTLIHKIQDNLDYDNQYMLLESLQATMSRIGPLNIILNKMAGPKAT